MASSTPTTQFLIIGAGPYGLAACAYARQLGCDVAMVGKPMEFWQRNMPGGMYLRSGIDWHLDPGEVHTFESFIAENNIPKDQTQPVPIDLYLKFTQWFQDKYDLQTGPSLVKELRYQDGLFEVNFEDDRQIKAQNVLLALGFANFVNTPQDIIEKIPAGRWSHTCTTVNFDSLKGRRCLILGGRQSAYETAALLAEAGAAEVHIAHRHPTPAFTPSDWSWVTPLVKRTAQEPGWFSRLSSQEQDDIRKRMWGEGRLKLEPWLAPRLNRPNVYSHPLSELAACELIDNDDGLHITLSTGEQFNVDHILLATGYKVNIPQVPFLSKDSLLPHLKLNNGFPVLDGYFQSSIPGLYFSGLPATNDLGPFFGFTVGCAATGKVIVEHIMNVETR
jgi:FAD-dependent urate hydroxylase